MVLEESAMDASLRRKGMGTCKAPLGSMRPKIKGTRKLIPRYGRDSFVPHRPRATWSDTRAIKALVHHVTCIVALSRIARMVGGKGSSSLAAIFWPLWRTTFSTTALIAL